MPVSSDHILLRKPCVTYRWVSFPVVICIPELNCLPKQVLRLLIIEANMLYLGLRFIHVSEKHGTNCRTAQVRRELRSSGPTFCGKGGLDEII